MREHPFECIELINNKVEIFKKERKKITRRRNLIKTFLLMVRSTFLKLNI